MVRDINALNEELDAAGARVFAGGLEPASMAKSLRKQANGDVIITDGPYLRPRSTSVVSRYSKPLTWTRRLHGHVRPSLPVGCRSRCGIFFRPRNDRQA